MEGEKSLRKYSPELLVQDKTMAKAIPLLPPIILFHGTEDYSIPPDARSVSFPEFILPLMACLIP